MLMLFLIAHKRLEIVAIPAMYMIFFVASTFIASFTPRMLMLAKTTSSLLADFIKSKRINNAIETDIEHSRAIAVDGLYCLGSIDAPIFKASAKFALDSSDALVNSGQVVEIDHVAAIRLEGLGGLE